MAVDKNVGSGALKEIASELMWSSLCHCLSHTATLDDTNSGNIATSGTELASFLSYSDPKYGFS